MKLVVTGGCGFLGSNLAAHAVSLGWELLIFDNLSRLGSQDNLEWLRRQGALSFVQGDVRNRDDVERTMRDFGPDAVFHLAGQVAMTTSLANPRMDFETNALGTFNVLEAVRAYAAEARVLYSSTNKVYGDLEQYRYRETETRYECVDKPNGFAEDTPLAFASPYGCSKGAADQYMLDYARMYGLRTTVFRHSSMYGGRQFATYDQGWVGWFCRQATESKHGRSTAPFTISGNGKQVRDVLHADDMIRLYFLALEKAERVRGKVFNIGGGMENSLSLIELFSLLTTLTRTELRYTCLPARQSDQRVFVADISFVRDTIGWSPQVAPSQGIGKMIEWTETISTGA